MIRDMHVLLSKWAGEHLIFFSCLGGGEGRSFDDVRPGGNATDSHSLSSDNRTYRESRFTRIQWKELFVHFLQGSGSTTGNTLVVVVVCDYSDRYWAIARIE